MTVVQPIWIGRKPQMVRWALRVGLVLLALLLLLGGAQTPPAALQAAQESDGVGAAALPGWDSRRVLDPTVIKDGSLFKMWYTGEGLDMVGRIGYATSSDGVTWTKHADKPVLDSGGTGSWDEGWVRPAAVIKQGAVYHMWYSSNGKIGYATSPDGVHWTKDDAPVLVPGTAPQLG